MPFDYKAFSVNSHGLLRVIKTKANVTLARSIASARKIPFKDVEVDAIWDTGATNTSISQEVAKKLNLQPLGKTPVVSAGKKYISNIYRVDILLPQKVAVLDLPVTEALSIDESEILIGMDIITLGDFSVTNAGGKTCCSFRLPPDIKHIDYVEEWKKSQEKHKRRRSVKKRIGRKIP